MPVIEQKAPGSSKDIKQIIRRLCLRIIYCIGLMGAVLYLAFPFYVPIIVSEIADDAELGEWELALGYPRLSGIPISKVEWRSKQGHRVVLNKGWLSYRRSQGVFAYFSEAAFSLEQATRPEEKKNVSSTLLPYLPESALPSRVLAKLPRFRFGLDAVYNTLEDGQHTPLAKSLVAKHHQGSLVLSADFLQERPDASMLLHRAQFRILNDNSFTARILPRVSNSELVDNGVSNNTSSIDLPWLQLTGKLDFQEVMTATINTTIDVAALYPILYPNNTLYTVSGNVNLSLFFQPPTIHSDFIGEVFRENKNHTASIKKERLNFSLSTELKESKDGFNTVFFSKEERDNIQYTTSYYSADDATTPIEQTFTVHPLAPFKIHYDLAESTLFSENSFSSQLAIDNDVFANIEVGDIRLVQGFNASNIEEPSLEYILKFSGEPDMFARYVPEVTWLDEVVSLDVFGVTSAEKTVLTVKEKQGVSLKTTLFDEYNFSDMRVELVPQNISIDHRGQADISVSPLDVTLTLNPENEQTELGMIRSYVQSSYKDKSLSLTARSDMFNYGEYVIPVLNANANILKNKEDRWQAEFSLSNYCDSSLMKGMWLAAQVDQNLPSVLDIKIDRVFFPENSAKHWLNMASLPMDITSGELLAQIRLEGDGDNTQLTVNAQLLDAKLVGATGEFDHVQLAFSSAEAESHNEHYKFDVTSRIGFANVGAEIRNLEMKGSIFQPLPSAKLKTQEGLWYGVLEKGEGDIYGGTLRLSSKPSELKKTMLFDLHLEDIDLSQVVATQNIEGLRTTGKLSGVLPLAVGLDGIAISDGQLHNKDGGLIRYLSPIKGSAQTNEQLQLTLDVLENFNYEILDTRVDFDQSVLRFQSKISGRNPDVANGQRVDLNLNTEVDMASTMQLLRLQSGLEEHIQQFVNESLSVRSKENICQP